MKETTKYNKYRFVGKIQVDEIQPWFDFDKSKPWDELEVPWVLDNKVRREILIALAKGAKNLEEIHNSIAFSPKPLLISPEEYKTNVKFQWGKETLENHLLNLEWYDLIKKSGEKYQLMIPILGVDKLSEIDNYLTQLVDKWISVLKELKDEIGNKFSNINCNNAPLYGILVEKAVEKLYEKMKSENLLPNKPNIKSLWAEQLRKLNFEDWITKNF